MASQEKEEYIVFADPVMGQLCADLWGDGVGITPSQAAAVKTFNGLSGFESASVVSFDEMQYFTGLGTGASDQQYCTNSLFFYRFPNVTSVVWPEIAYISGSTFRSSKFTSIDFPATVNWIGTLAFANAAQLATLVFRATTPPTLGNGAIQGNASGLKIYVPNGYGNTYKAASGWSSYASIIYELNPDGTIPS